MIASTSVRGHKARERVRYFSRQLLTADDLTADQEYFRQRLRRHNRFLHGWGVVCGCDVAPPAATDPPWTVKICPGYVLTPQGDEILIAEAVTFDLSSGWARPADPCAPPSPCPPTGRRVTGDENEPVYLAVCYDECDARPVRVHPVGCACDEAGCEYSRIRDAFEIALLPRLPASHTAAETTDEEWCAKIRKWADERQNEEPVPNWGDYPGDSCVVLARITLPAGPGERITEIDYQGRRPLYSVTALHQLVKCLGHIA